MPLYEFRCPEGHDFEKFYRSIGTAAAEEKCPVCGEVAARVMSAAGLVFKGSGFYITDYGKDGKKAEREAATAASASAAKAEKSDGDSAPKADSSTEPKPSDAPAAKPVESSTVAPVATPKVPAKPAATPAPKAKTGNDA